MKKTPQPARANGVRKQNLEVIMTSTPKRAPIEVPETDAILPNRLMDTAPNTMFWAVYLQIQYIAFRTNRLSPSAASCEATDQQIADESQVEITAVREGLAWLQENGWIELLGENKYLVAVHE